MRLVIQKRRRHYWGRRDTPGEFHVAPDAAMLGKVVDTPHPCSCWACRNPRHSPLFKGKARLTFQELRADEWTATFTSAPTQFFRLEMGD
jgi:hypothetical protein